MTTKKFSNALGNIGENYINEAATYSGKRKKETWVKWVSIAACLSLVVAGGIFGNIFNSPDTPDNTILSYFVITAHAATGETTDLSVASSCFNSVPASECKNLFGVDMPIFNFSVKPSDLKNNEAIYSRFDISIAYNDTVIDTSDGYIDKDEHISIAYIFSVSEGQTCGYSIMGWFTEPTDIIVTIIDKESREVVETITVNVNYNADRQGYNLEVTNLTTKFSE